MQVPRFIDGPTEHQEREQGQQHGEGKADNLYDPDARRGPFEGASKSLPHFSTPAVESQKQHQQRTNAVSITVRFVVTYSGPGELRDATLNISPPLGFLAEPSSVLLPPVRGTGSVGKGVASGGGAERGGGSNEPLVVEIVLNAERGTGRLPSTLVGHASVVYTRQGAVGDGRSEPMSARCDLRVPLAMAGELVEPSTRKGVNAHKFTFSTNRPAVPLGALFEDVSAPPSSSFMSHGSSPSPSSLEDSKLNGVGGAPAGISGRSGGGGALASGVIGESTSFSFRYWAAAAADTEGGRQDVSVAVSKNSGRYRVQSESLPALSVVAAEVVRRLREYFGETGDGRDRGREERSGVDDRKTNPDEGETIQQESASMSTMREDVGREVELAHPDGVTAASWVFAWCAPG